MQTPRLRDLRAFSAAARLGSAGAAARALGLSQPAISQALARLEAHFGAAVLVRGPRGCSATPPGALLLDRIDRMERHLLAGCGGAEGASRRLTDSAINAHLAIVAARGIAAAARAGPHRQACIVRRAAWSPALARRCIAAVPSGWSRARPAPRSPAASRSPGWK